MLQALRTLDAAAKAKKAKKKNKAADKAAAAAATADGSNGHAAVSGACDSLKRKAPEAAANGAAAASGAPKPRLTGATDAAKAIAIAEAKKYKAGDHAPAHADPKIWGSLFTSSVVENRKETYGARALSFHR